MGGGVWIVPDNVFRKRDDMDSAAHCLIIIGVIYKGGRGSRSLLKSGVAILSTAYARNDPPLPTAMLAAVIVKYAVYSSIHSKTEPVCPQGEKP